MGATKAQVRNPKPKWIIRSSHNNQSYFLMARATAQDDRLSWSARGMLAYLLSKPDDWRVSIKDLQQGCGRDKVYKLLDELILYRYVVRSKTSVIDYYVYETPLPENTEVNDKTGLPENTEVISVSALPEKPLTDFQDAYIIQNKEQNTESTENMVAEALTLPTNEPIQSTIVQEVPKQRKSSGKKKADVPPPEPGVLDAICLLCYGTPDAYGPNAANIRKCYNEIAEHYAPVLLSEVKSFGPWWTMNDWRGKKGESPEPHWIPSKWATFKLEITNGQTTGTPGTAPSGSAANATISSGGTSGESSPGNGQVPKFAPADGTGRKPWERVAKSA